MGSGGGQVVSVLAFDSGIPSSNPADAYSFFVKFVFEKYKKKQKESGPAHFYKNNPTHTLMPFTRVTNAHGSSFEPTANMSSFDR